MFDLSLLQKYDGIVDVRSPAEFAEDRIPGARNLPALHNDERAAVGLLHKTDPFLARRQGAQMLAANIARHLGGELSQPPPDWRPLVYCWRGGQRSDAVVEVLRRIGWRAEKLPGGYKSYRRAVMDELRQIPPRVPWRVLSGKTGVGKTALLKKLRALGAAVVDLESLAGHRGSVFGGLGAQPSQRQFESDLLFTLRQLPEGDTVFVESESRKIGKLHLPPTLLRAIRQAPQIRITADMDDRVRHILGEYQEYLRDTARFCETICRLQNFIGKKKSAQWRAWHDAQAWCSLTEDLLRSFYDIGYEKSLGANFPGESSSRQINPGDDRSLTRAAREIIAGRE